MTIVERIIDSITKDDIIDIMTSFNVSYEKCQNGDLKFESCCHGSTSKKLYYYEYNSEGEVSKHFICYSHCGGMSIFNVLMKMNNWSFSEAKNYLANYKGISCFSKKKPGFGLGVKPLDDWDFISKYQKKNDNKKLRLLPEIKFNLSYFENIYPTSWVEDHISLEAMHKFHIKFSALYWKAVIPHYDYMGRLVGIRGRSFLQRDLDNGQKYMPMYIENTSFRHPLQQNLYGLYENLETIKQLGKVIIFEGEKSVLQCETYYPNNNFAVAICGTNLSNYQKNLLVHTIGIKEVIIALDKQYKTKLDSDEDMREYKRYIQKVEKIANQFVNYVDVNIIYCDDERLKYKDSPSDQGEEILQQLMKEKERYYRHYE